MSGELATRQLGDIVRQLSLDIPEEPERVDELAGAMTTLTNGGDWAVAAMVSARTEEGSGGPRRATGEYSPVSYREYAEKDIRGLRDHKTVKFYAKAWEARFPKPALGETVALPDEEFPSRTVSVHHSSEDNEWETPQALFDELDAEFKFELDVCALDATAKCPTHFTPEDDGLAQSWQGFRCWMNPPYGDVIGDWVEKAWNEAEGSSLVVCLVPARVDTAWWWDYCRFGEVRFLRGRLKFGEAETSAPFPSAVVVFGVKPRVVWWER